MRYLLLLLLLLPGACDTRGHAPDDAPVVVSVIGPRPRIVDPTRRGYTPPDAVLLGAVAQGLVRFDAAGQVNPGLAIRWDVSDDGLYYTFRIAPDATLDAAAVARRLRAAIAPGSENPLASELTAIAEVLAVTDAVVEIRLSAPRPDLLQLLAQPALAMIGTRPPGGSGPFRILSRDRAGVQGAARGAARLTPARPTDDPTVPDAVPDPAADIVLRGERAALAVARFKAGAAGVVLAGRFTDIAIARADGGAATTLHIDPATGLFGFAIVDNHGLLSAPENRLALALALDRDRIVRLFADGWAVRTGIVPAGGDDLPDPVVPDWSATPLPRRIAVAAATIAGWRARNPAVPPTPLRIAMPAGPGARMLYALAAQDWRRIGVDTVAVAADAPADLRLVDRVAPSGSAAWYLHRFTCDRSPLCSERADAALAAARTAPDPVSRTARLADADRSLADIGVFIAIASPLRWALVAPNLKGYRDNARAIHALDQLRSPD
ncbi:ABC transporter substrate-binding protein [Sphingomonas montana]|uniref:ABC transporter substrate-binding protein n=1 Tax=Sphingomonas montana TaxID=1843236 RepID=UPI00096D6193|nr:ABC transporter substrate-binding protein [Sphingomonas montana]